jgi:hypothetical protein
MPSCLTAIIHQNRMLCKPGNDKLGGRCGELNGATGRAAVETAIPAGGAKIGPIGLQPRA